MAMRRLPSPNRNRPHGTRDGRHIDSRRRDRTQERIGSRRRRDLPEYQAKPAPGSDSERVDQRLKRRRLMASARVVQEVALERRAPVLEHPHERAARYVFGHVLLEQESQSRSVQRGTDVNVGSLKMKGPETDTVTGLPRFSNSHR